MFRHNFVHVQVKISKAVKKRYTCILQINTCSVSIYRKVDLIYALVPKVHLYYTISINSISTFHITYSVSFISQRTSVYTITITLFYDMYSFFSVLVFHPAHCVISK